MHYHVRSHFLQRLHQGVVEQGLYLPPVQETLQNQWRACCCPCACITSAPVGTPFGLRAVCESAPLRAASLWAKFWESVCFRRASLHSGTTSSCWRIFLRASGLRFRLVYHNTMQPAHGAYISQHCMRKQICETLTCAISVHVHLHT